MNWIITCPKCNQRYHASHPCCPECELEQYWREAAESHRRESARHLELVQQCLEKADYIAEMKNRKVGVK